MINSLVLSVPHAKPFAYDLKIVSKLLSLIVVV